MHTEVVYIDDPFVLDDPSVFYRRIPSASADHRYHLRKKLFWPDTEANVFDEIIAKDKLNSIYEKKISSVCSGDIIRSKRSVLGYQRKGSDKVLNVRNLSTGLKTFVILEDVARQVERLSVMVQLSWMSRKFTCTQNGSSLFAELIVLIQKEFGNPCSLKHT